MPRPRKPMTPEQRAHHNAYQAARNRALWRLRLENDARFKELIAEELEHPGGSDD